VTLQNPKERTSSAKRFAIGRPSPREKKAMTVDAGAIVRTCFEAYVAKDRAAIESLIADDFHFTSPLDNRIDRTTYFDRCWPNSESVDHFEFVRIVPHGQNAFVTYEGHGKNGVFRNTELFTIRGGKIIEVEVYFGWSVPHKAAPGGFVNENA
jgi:hypothetical protein